jgi:hypothetical protein
MTIISLGRRLPAVSSSLPGGRTGEPPAGAPGEPDRAIPPVWPCSRWGLPQPTSHLVAGKLLPHHFTLTHCWAVCFCGTLPGVAPAGCYPASRSAEFGLSSDGSQATRDCLAYSNPSVSVSSCIAFSQALRISWARCCQHARSLVLSDQT